jgi:hypothetical protein
MRDGSLYRKIYLFYANEENIFQLIVKLSFMGITGTDVIPPTLPG